MFYELLTVEKGQNKEMLIYGKALQLLRGADRYQQPKKNMDMTGVAVNSIFLLLILAGIIW